MSRINISSVLNKKNLLITFLIVSGLLLFENMFSRVQWIPYYNTIAYDPVDNAVVFTFKVYDYKFGPFDEDGYIRWCDFSYSTDGANFTHLFRIETNDQTWTVKHPTIRDWFYWTWLYMRYKIAGAQIQFLGDLITPERGTIWPDNNEDVRVEVFNDRKPDHLAHMTIKWFLNTPDTDYQNAKYIKLNGFWKVNGLYKGDDINAVYEIPVKVELKSNNLNNSSSTLESEVLISKFAAQSGILIKGAKLGENIKVYNVSGSEINSVIANNEVLTIKLAKNMVYIISIGQNRYKIVL